MEFDADDAEPTHITGGGGGGRRLQMSYVMFNDIIWLSYDFRPVPQMSYVMFNDIVW